MASTYAWEDDSIEFYLRDDSISGMSTWYPDGELTYALIGDRQIIASNYKLAWKFKIWAIKPDSLLTVYVDAQNGQIIKETAGGCNGSFNHIYYGNRYIDTRWTGSVTRYKLFSDDNGRNIKTKDEKYDKSWKNDALPSDHDDFWGNDHHGATSCHFVVQEAWSFYNQTYGRFGLNGAGKEIRVHANVPGFRNAQYSLLLRTDDYDVLMFGKINNNSLATVDIGAHEYSHGVDEYTASLDYERESGALDESFADIFGTMAERFVFGTNNWTIGENAIILRDMQNPTLYNQPSYRLGPNWVSQNSCTPTGNNDFCGVHTNSGTPNHWFFY